LGGGFPILINAVGGGEEKRKMAGKRGKRGESQKSGVAGVGKKKGDR